MSLSKILISISAASLLTVSTASAALVFVDTHQTPDIDGTDGYQDIIIVEEDDDDDLGQQTNPDLGPLSFSSTTTGTGGATTQEHEFGVVQTDPLLDEEFASEVPIPAALPLFGFGLAGLMGLRKKRSA